MATKEINKHNQKVIPMKNIQHRILQFLTSRDKIQLLRFSIGLIYFWFGSLKFVSGLSPAENLASETLGLITFQLIPVNISYWLLAAGETIIGIMLILNIRIKLVIVLALAHMVGTFAPLVLLPEVSFTRTPFSITLIGQYILKNLVIVSALVVLFPFQQKPKLTT